MLIKICGKDHQISLFKTFVALVLIMKIILAILFSSDYQNIMFIPFVDSFLSHIGTDNWNTYQLYYENGYILSFPYPPIMLFIESIGGILLKTLSYAGISSVFLNNLLFKVPLFLFDLLGVYYLKKMFPEHLRYIAIIYYTCPIILYSTYMHGQTDIIPTTLLLGSLFKLKRTGEGYNPDWSAVLFSLALLSKIHIVAILPLIILYIGKKYGIKMVVRYILIVAIITVTLIFPFFSEGFIQTVLFNSEQSALKAVSFSFGNVEVYISILTVMIVYLIAYTIRSINDELLMAFSGIIFAIFLSLCPPMPGWYVWITPFIAIFSITATINRYQSIIIYAILNILYLIYFVFFHKKKYVDLYFMGMDMSGLKIDNAELCAACFTALCATLFFIIWQMYKSGIAANSLYKRKNIPFMIGISGDSGSGKSTFINMLEKVLGKNNLLFIEGDGDHRWERGEKMWKEYTHLNPKANLLYRQAHDIEKLRKGVSVKRVEYNHDTGKFSEPHRIRPKKYVLLCGLHALYLPQMRRSLDLMIYMDTDEKLRRYWKIQRDISVRGYTKEKILEQIELRTQDAEKYIYPQKQYADIVIYYFDKSLKDCIQQNHKVVLSVKLTISAAIDIECVLKELRDRNIKVDYDFSEDLEQQIIIIDGNTLPNETISFWDLSIKLVPQIDEITLEHMDNLSNLDGIVALFVLLFISKKLWEEI